MLPNLRVFHVVCNYLGYFTLRCLRKQPRRGYSAAALLSGGCLAFVPKFLFFISSSSNPRLPAAYHPRGIHVFYSIYRPAFFEYTQSMFSPCRCIIPKYDSDKTLTCFLKHVIIVEQTTDISRCFGYFYCSRGICHV